MKPPLVQISFEFDAHMGSVKAKVGQSLYRG